ncbi:MAG: tail fiber domain-containing protein [Mangrovimonas sp.]|nr:tail fiber domain-containing protein [Mangrovimonas sp.]
MKKILAFIVWFFCILGYSQVGINTTDPKAQLEIQSSNQASPSNTDGLLIPKVDAFPVTNPTAAQQGMLVYLTTTVGVNSPGFYYWDNTTSAWIPIGNNSNLGWNLTGNTGTNPSVNFIGTMDAQDLVFKRNNVISGKISTFNTSLGFSSLLTNSSGSTAFGYTALQLNSGNNNSGFGNQVLRSVGTGGFNSGFGANTMRNITSGTNNTGMGFEALLANTEGNYNTAVGSEADVAANNLSNTTAIGANAQVGASNSMVLGSINGVNGATADVNVGIGTTTPQDKLHVVGNIRMADGNEAAGRIMVSDANGTASWEDVSVASGWGLIGNTGTNPSTNFIGTTDNQDVIFKRNNRLAGRIGNGVSQLRTSFGDNAASSLTSGTSISAFGVNALEENTTGGQNNAFGSAALRFNTSGTGNSAFGNSALIANISGNANAAFGTQALQSNRASMNAAVGYQALENNTTGSGNTALGHMALTGNVDGSFNTAIGKGTGVLSTSNPSNATAIGAFARVDTSNSLVLGSIIGVNGATSSVNVGIGTASPARRLHVSNGASGGTSNANTGILLESDVNVYQHFLTPNSRESGLLFGSNTASIHGGIIFDNSDEDISFRTGGNTTRMTLINSGYLGIGTATPAGQLELSLDEGRKPASSTWTITSDARLKNVTGDYHKGLTEIIALKPIRYNYKNTDKRTFEQDVLNKEAYGFLAQEVQTVFPEAVGVDDDGYLNFNLHPILIASINAFKELNTKYEEVKSENEALKDKLNALLVRVEALENQ